MTESRTSLVTLALLVVVVASAAVAAGTTSVTQNDRDAIPPEHGGAHGVDDVTFWKLWSNDVDDPDSIDDNFDHENVNDPEAAREASKGADFLFDRPPEAVQQWNDGDIGDFSPGGDDTSKVVDAANTKSASGSGVDIEDAYVKVFSIDPSTVVHRPGREERYVTESPTLRAISDFRYEKSSGSGSFDDTKYVEKYQSPSTSATVRVKKDGATVDSYTTGGSVGTISHDYSVSGTADLSVEVEYEVTVDHKKWKCDDWNASESDCEGTYDKYHDDEHTVTRPVSDGDTVTKQDEPEVEVAEYEYEGQDEDRGVVVVEPDGLWKTIDLGDMTIESQWMFYTRSPDRWETMETRESDGTTDNPSDVRPVVVHAYPAFSEPKVEKPRSLQRENISMSTSAGPLSLGSDITVVKSADRKPLESYVVSADDLSEHDITPNEATGLVATGQAESVVNTSLSVEQGTVESTRIELRSKSKVSGGTKYEIAVLNSSNQTVEEGALVVGQDRYQLDGDPIEVTVEEGLLGGALVRYEPPNVGFTVDGTDGTLYQQTSSRRIFPGTPADVPTPFQLLELTFFTLFWFVPLMIAGVALDYLLGIRLFRDAVPSVDATLRGIRNALFDR